VPDQTRGKAGSTLLSQSDVVPYLLDAGIISPVADGSLQVVDVSRRNLVFVVGGQRSPTFVVKQSRSSDDPAVAREVAVLRRLGSLDAPVNLGRLVPALIAYDARQKVLVLETEAGARDFRDQYARGRFSIALARACGSALGLLHSLPPDGVGPRPSGLEPVWPLSWHRPQVQQLFELSTAGLGLLRLVQGSQPLCEALDELRESWREESVIHGDLRWENWIAAPARPSRGRDRVLMIDWELAGAGDPCLDIGAFFAEYLVSWVDSIPIVDPRDPGRMFRHAGRPLDRMQPAIGQFWATYRMARGEHVRQRLLSRAVRFAAARLLQAAVEQTERDPELRAHTVCAVQLAVNILELPDEAAARLLGLPAGAGRL
jgi:aminoglycoside phosphotransferase (APT) family kinase protein